MLDRFTYEEYGRLLDCLRGGRANLCFGECSASQAASYFLLRHDIDFSLADALKMAQFEAKQGIRATYFLLLSCGYYNLLAENACDVPRQLIDLGHEVGLHYDVRAMARRSDGDLKRQLQVESGLLAMLTDRPIRSIAMHNPSIYGADPFLAGSGFVNVYDPRFTQAIAYYSDSCGAWRNKAYEVFTSGRIPDQLQVLIHPFLWGDEPGDRWDRLSKWTAQMIQHIEYDETDIKKIWLNHSGVREHESREAKVSSGIAGIK